MKKLRNLLLASVLAFSAALLPSAAMDEPSIAAAAETSENAAQEAVSGDSNDGISKGVAAVIIIGVFTVTFAVSGVLTYKIRRKNLSVQKNKADDADNKE